MAKINTFRQLEVWQAAMELVLVCYQTTASFPTDERYGLSAQIRRASVSIPANVAEGHNRRSRRAYRNHVHIALGSQAELGTLLELSARLAYLSPEQWTALQDLLRRIGQMLHGLARALRGETAQDFPE